MNCRKCKKEIPDASRYCLYCGTDQNAPVRTPKRRGNGQGTVYKDGNSFVARVDIYAPQRRTLRRYFKTKKEAVASLPELREKLSGVRIVPPSITFSSLYQRWVPYYEDRVSKGSMASHSAAFNHFAPIHSFKFSQITVENLQDCIDKCPRGKRVKEDMKCLASLLYKYAYDLNLSDKNLAKNLYCGKEKKGTRPAFTMEEVETIRKAVGVEPYADYVYCLIYTGFRPGELLEISRDRYDPERHCFIEGKKTEAGIDRIVTISPKIQPIVDRLYSSGNAWLFGKPDGSQMTDEYFRKSCFMPLMKKLNIAGRVPYSCRHTFANLLKVVAGSDTDKAALMGHADASMTKYYQSADYDALRKITNAI